MTATFGRSLMDGHSEVSVQVLISREIGKVDLAVAQLPRQVKSTFRAHPANGVFPNHAPAMGAIALRTDGRVFRTVSHFNTSSAAARESAIQTQRSEM